ncbi:MAG: hypothetical protein ACJ0SL_06000 [Candidatus Rariloculaceae bacterium]
MIIHPLAIGIGVSFCYVAARHDVAVIWPTIGLLLIAFFGSGFNTHFYFPTTVNETASIGGGFGIYPAILIQGALASFGLLGTYFWWRHRRQHSPE